MIWALGLSRPARVSFVACFVLNDREYCVSMKAVWLVVMFVTTIFPQERKPEVSQEGPA